MKYVVLVLLLTTTACKEAATSLPTNECEIGGMACMDGFDCRKGPSGTSYCVENTGEPDAATQDGQLEIFDQSLPQADASIDQAIFNADANYRLDAQTELGCEDGTVNGDETDVDCGGQCGPCPDFNACRMNSDCESGVCALELCQPAACDDNIKNGSETDVDCGGQCPGCSPQQNCATASDCHSSLCENMRCRAPECNDAIQNGSESDLDCGGTCNGCNDGQQCLVAEDCLSGVCQEGTCQPSSCDDRVKNGNETDEDCGGICEPCDALEACMENDDCQSQRCEDGLCQTPRCGDGVLNEGEQCDDQNLYEGDGCASDCTQEPGWRCDDMGCVNTTEFCDDQDNDSDGDIDEGCDFDGDGFCHANAVLVGSPAVCPYALVDCCDRDDKVYPGQTDFFTSPNNCATFDYNCNGSLERQRTQILICSAPRCSGAGWNGSVPACGQSGELGTCSMTILECTPSIRYETQGCR